MTDPDGTVVLDAVVTAPTVRPAPVIAPVAAASVRPTTSGTVIGGGVNPTARISTVARFQRSLVGTVSLIVATVPVLATSEVIDCTQNVWFALLSTNWCVIV